MAKSKASVVAGMGTCTSRPKAEAARESATWVPMARLNGGSPTALLP